MKSSDRVSILAGIGTPTICAQGSYTTRHRDHHPPVRRLAHEFGGGRLRLVYGDRNRGTQERFDIGRQLGRFYVRQCLICWITQDQAKEPATRHKDRKRAVVGKNGTVGEDLGGRRSMK